MNLDNNKNVIYRVLRFDPTLPIKNDDDLNIVVDWRGWLALSDESEDVKKAIPLKITRANCFEVFFKASWNHPEPTQKLSFRIAVMFGSLSLLLGLLGLVIAFCK